jgi:hypothetical protein
MKERNLSMAKYFNDVAKNWEPVLSFKGKTKKDWIIWRKKATKKFFELLGEFPKKVPLKPKVIWLKKENNLIKEKIIFNSENNMSIPCIVIKPINMKPDKKNRAIICSHGHGPYGKDAVAGLKLHKDLINNIKEHNYNYGEQMAEHGFLTISPDLRVFGERSDGENPYPGRDKCNVHFIRGMIMGIYTLTLNIWDIKCCVDYLETRPEVNPKRIGMMGLSQGGTMTTFATASEPRIKVADIIGYVNSWKKFGIQRANLCGSQILPDIYKYFDTYDIAGLIAPRPLLVEMGKLDTCFFIKDLIEGYKGIEKIYKAAGVSDKLEADIHSGAHSFAGNKAFSFFDKYL